MNSFGRMFRISIFGESHGSCIGVVIDGCPPGIPIAPNDFLPDLARRKSGAKGTTPRLESDLPLIQSGVFNDQTTGAPLTITFENKNTSSKDYSQFVDVPRPGHADFTAAKKYHGANDYRGGGHFSGRLTLGLVAAGVLAKKIVPDLRFTAELIEAGGSTDIEQAIEAALRQNDSIGGIVACRITNLPVGLGEPFFDSVESLISHIIFAIPAVRAIEFGAGFAAARMKGSEHNDCFVDLKGRTATNHAGGINGGITNGNEIVFRVCFKPTSSIAKAQQTMNMRNGEMTELIITGRHDACIALRAPVVVEAAAAIVLADLSLI